MHPIPNPDTEEMISAPKAVDPTKSTQPKDDNDNNWKDIKQECNRLLSTAFTKVRLATNHSFFSGHAKTLILSTEQHQNAFSDSLKDIISSANQIQDSTDWTTTGLFRLFLSWCLCQALPHSILETFLIDLLLSKTRSLSPFKLESTPCALQRNPQQTPSFF